MLSFLTLGAWAQLFSFTYLSVLIFSGTFLAATFRRRKRLTAGLSRAPARRSSASPAKLSLASAG